MCGAGLLVYFLFSSQNASGRNLGHKKNLSLLFLCIGRCLLLPGFLWPGTQACGLLEGSVAHETSGSEDTWPLANNLPPAI